MKKLLTFLMMSVLAIGVGWAGTSTLTVAKVVPSSGTQTATNDVTWNYSITWGDDGAAGTMNVDGTKGAQIGSSTKPARIVTFSTSGITGTITGVKVNASTASSATASLSVSVGGTTYGASDLTSTATDYTFNGTSSGEIVVTINQPTTKKALYLKYIEVTFDNGGVATPTFSIPAGRYYETKNVEINCATDGAIIHYSTDGTNYSNYLSSITISETTTLFAYASKDDMDDSDVASARYVIIDNSPSHPGDDVMFDYRKDAEFAQENQTPMVQSLKKGITIDFAKGTGDNTTPTWYENANGNARVYKNNTITVNAGDLVIEKVTFAFEGANVISGPTPSVGSYSNGVWTVGDKSAVLTMNSDASVARIATITVKLADAGTIVVAAPTISGNESFVGSTQVTITAEDGASIYYTTDGTDPTVESTLYTAPFTINETTTIKAIAAIEGTLSSIASKTFTAIPSVSTVAAFNALNDNTVIGFTGNLIAVAQKDQYLYAQDDTKGILIYGSTGQTYTLGNVIPGGFTGTKTTYKGAPEMTNPSGLAASTSTVQVTPIELTPLQVTLENFGRYAVIRGATISDGNIVVADESVDLYNRFLEEDAIPTDNKTYDITGVCGYYNGTQFMPLTFTEVQPAAEAEYYLAGDFTNWVNDDTYKSYKFTKLASGSYALNGVELEEGVEFKIIKVENESITAWYGGTNDKHNISSSNHTDIELVDGMNFVMTKAGNNNFVISNDMKLTINRDAKLFMKGSYSNDEWATKTPLEQTETGWTLTMEMADETQFGFVDEWENWKGGNGYWIYQNEHQYNNETVASDMGKELTIGSDGNFVMVDAGKYTFDVNSALTTLVVNLVPVAHNVIVADNIVNGTVTVDKESAITGEIVTITVTPADGYIPDVVTVMAGETPVALIGHTFVMPNADVTVSATFKEFARATNFKQVTALSQLEAGKQILLVGVREDVGVYVMNTTGTNNRQATQLNETGELPTFITYAESYNTLVLGTSDTYYNFYEVGNKGYIQPANNGKNQIKVGNLCDNAFVNITIEDGIFDVVFSKSEAERRNLRYNPTPTNDGYTLFSCYASGQNPVYIYIETDEDPQPEPVVLDGVAFTADRQWATWYGDANLALPEGVTAYVVTGVQGDAVAVEAVNYIPANTGVLLNSETGAESVSAMPYTGEAGTIPTNLLVGSLEAQTVSNAYLLYNNQFILAQDGTTVGAHRCYLPMSASAQGAPVLRIGQPGTVTGVETISTNNNGDNTYYNLMGQPVANPAPGIYIRGGKKVIVK